MGHVKDRWTRPGPSGRRVRTDRWGRGKRWLASWVEPGGLEKARAFASKDAAEAHLATVDVDIRGGNYVRESRTTFREYATEWMGRQVHQSPATVAAVERFMRLHAFPVIGDLPIQSVTRAQVQQLVVVTSKPAGTLGPTAVRGLHAYVQAVFLSAVEDRLIGASPCRSISLPKTSKTLVHPLDVPAVRAIAARMRETCPRLEGMVWLGAGTGLRPGELKSLTVDRVDGDVLRVDRQLVERGTTAAKVVWGPLKNDASYRSLPITTATQKRLLQHMERFPPGRFGLLFASARGGALNRARLSEEWGSATEGMALADRSGWHALRHHHASLLIAKGLSPRAVADRLGHADPSETLSTYSHLWPSDHARILAALDDAYGESDGPEPDPS